MNKRSLHPTSNNQKKVKFEEIDDTEVNLDQIKRRRDKIKDEYESDEQVSESDSDQEPEQDVDMFGTKSKFMNLTDVEGQEPSQLVNDGDFPLEEFNLKNEFDEGDFTQQGQYVVKRDEYRIHDQWLEGVGKVEIERAKEIKMKMDNNSIQVESSDPKLMKLELRELLLQGETPMQALQRLGKITKIKRGQKPDEKVLQARQLVTKITQFCTQLLDTDQNIYDKQKQDI